MSRLLLIACLLTLTACGSYFPPSPTTRPASVSDLAGSWSYQPLAEPSTDVLLELRRDGTFTQTATRPQGVRTSTGQWRINGSSIELDAVLTEFDNWAAPQAEGWRIIDRGESPAGFAILGGAVDPDQWVILRWIP